MKIHVMYLYFCLAHVASLMAFTTPTYLHTTSPFSRASFNLNSDIHQRTLYSRGSSPASAAATTALNISSRRVLSNKIRNQNSAMWLSSNIPSLNEGDSGEEIETKLFRSKLRKLTGFSFTAFRVTMKAATGFSLTASRATLRGLTGVSISGIMKVITGVFPLWARAFFQPFLMLYYTPLIILRSLIGSTKNSKSEAKAAHEYLIDGWTQAIIASEDAQNGGYWPVHVDEKRQITVSLPPDPIRADADLTEGVAQSVEFVLNNADSSNSD